MTTLREAAQQALEALKLSAPKTRRADDDYAEQGWTEHNTAITALRAALAQQAEPSQEPVAWYSVDAPLNYMTRCADGTVFTNTVAMPAHAVAWSCVAPPQRKPLTEEKIDAEFDRVADAADDLRAALKHEEETPTQETDMTTLREAAQQALEALETVWPIIEGEKFKHECSYGGNFSKSKTDRARKACVESLAAIAALRAALAQQDEPVAGIIEPQINGDSHKTLDEAMQQHRAMAQAYENGYKAGVAAEREACAQACEARFMGDMTREDMEARRCAAAIRARGEQP